MTDQLKKGKVLIVDDVKIFQRMTGMALESNGYQVCTASNGREAVEKARVEMPDMILMDIIMPEMDGYQACEAIKKDAATKGIPVIMLTSIAKKDAIMLALQSGACDYLVKSGFKTSTLIEKIEQHINKK